MPEYKYKAQDKDGKTVKGKAQAADTTELQKRFRENGMMLLEVKPVVRRIALKELKKKQLADFCRQLGTLIKAGVSLVKSLEIIANDESIGNYERDLYLRLRDRIVQGVALSTAMEELEPAFPPLLTFMIRAAETSGTMDTTALRLADQYTGENELEQTAKNSLTYPKILSVLIVGVVAILFGYVLPQFKDLFDAMPELPITTRILMGISDFVAHKWYVIVIVVAFVAIFGKMIKKTPTVRYTIDKIKVKGKWGKLLRSEEHT